MKKFLALSLLVSFVGVQAADGEVQPTGVLESKGAPVSSSAVSLQERFKNHPWAGLGGGVSAAVLAGLAGARDPQKIVTAVLVGAGYGMASKEVLDRLVPQLPDDKFSNMGKGVVGPIGVKYFPNVLDLSAAGTRSIQGK